MNNILLFFKQQQQLKLLVLESLSSVFTDLLGVLIQQQQYHSTLRLLEGLANLKMANMISNGHDDLNLPTKKKE